MPPISALVAFSPDPAGIVLLLLAGIGLVAGFRRAAQRGAPASRLQIALLTTGTAVAAAALLGFPGAFAGQLRLAFVLKVALLLVVVPTLVAAGHPAAVLRAGCGPEGTRRIDAVLGSRPARLLGSAAVAPLIPLIVLLLLLTPFAGTIRTTGWGEALTDVVVPLLGLAVAVPLAEPAVDPTTFAVTAAFLIGFVELVADAIPGILMRLAATVLDGATHLAVHAPPWAPSPLRDQQLAGDLLWCIAEAADIPALVLLLIQWRRSDRRDARAVDELTDEQYAALAEEHLRAH